MWKDGMTNNIEWCIKVYDEGSRFGIDNGRISKLWMKKLSNGEEVVNYDRGWDIKPFDKNGNFFDADVQEVYNQIINKFN